MSKEEMRETCEGLTEDYEALKRYCEITEKGEITQLRGIIEAAFGHCDDTARQRVNHLAYTKVIIVSGKHWRFNQNGHNEQSKQIELLKSIRENPENNGHKKESE